MKKPQGGIMPIGPLMKEHRIIERMIRLMSNNVTELEKAKEPDLKFIDIAIDFLRTYADRCHHGKEEDILFCALSKKPLSMEHRKIMDALIKDHIYSRESVKALVAAKDRYAKGDKDALKEIIRRERDLALLYPSHIETEDKHFFLPIMKYFTEDEQDCMVQEFCAFDADLIHERYKSLIEMLEKQQG